MIVIFLALLLCGMPSGLAAYLQADTKGWLVLTGFALAFLAGVGLLLWAATDVGDWPWRPVTDLRGDPRFLAGGVLVGFMFWALVGSAIGKIFERKIAPIALGVRVAAGVSLTQFGLSILGILG